jgi:hypothetical protein
MRIQFFWYATLCWWVRGSQHFDTDPMFLQNHQYNDQVSHHRRYESQQHHSKNLPISSSTLFISSLHVMSEYKPGLYQVKKQIMGVPQVTCEQPDCGYMSLQKLEHHCSIQQSPSWSNDSCISSFMGPKNSIHCLRKPANGCIPNRWIQNTKSHCTSFWATTQDDSGEITNKMQPCNRIYYSTVH